MSHQQPGTRWHQAGRAQELGSAPSWQQGPGSHSQLLQGWSRARNAGLLCPLKGHAAQPPHKVSRASGVPKEMGILPLMDPQSQQELFQVLAANVGKSRKIKAKSLRDPAEDYFSEPIKHTN